MWRSWRLLSRAVRLSVVKEVRPILSSSYGFSSSACATFQVQKESNASALNKECNNRRDGGGCATSSNKCASWSTPKPTNTSTANQWSSKSNLPASTRTPSRKASRSTSSPATWATSSSKISQWSARWPSLTSREGARLPPAKMTDWLLHFLGHIIIYYDQLRSARKCCPKKRCFLSTGEV